MSVGLPYHVGNDKLLNCISGANFIIWDMSNVFSTLSRLHTKSGINRKFAIYQGPLQNQKLWLSLLSGLWIK